MRLLCVSAALLAGACFESAAQPGVCFVDERRECTCEDGGLGWETCFANIPAVWGPCTCNKQPVANAGSDRTVPYNATVFLDATNSLDADGPDRIYEWMIVSAPAGSLAMLDDTSSARPSFFTDLPGQYRFALTVGDGLKTSEPVMTTVTATNAAPVAVVAPGRKLYTGTSFALDGSSSFDTNGDPLTFQWTVTSAPLGSTAVPASAAAAMTQFVPDVHGQYEISLTVNDGRAASTPATVKLDVYFPLTEIPYMRDAAYSAALDRVVTIGLFPNALYLYNPVTGASNTVALSQEPQALALSPDGLTAVVGHPNLVSVVNLQTRVVTLTKVMNAGTLDIVHGGNGYAYVFPSAGTNNAIQNVPLNSSAVTLGGLGPLMRAERVPGTPTIYAAFTASDEIYRYDIVSNSPTITRAVTAEACDDLWISDDGQRIFTRCATIFSTSDVAAQDMQLQGSIPGVTYVNSLAQSSTSNKLLVVPGDSTKVRIHTNGTLALEREITVPRFLINDMGYDAGARFVFLRSDNQSYTVILATSTSASTVCAIATFSL